MKNLVNPVKQAVDDESGHIRQNYGIFQDEQD
jgi:hypothetical protein